MKYIVINIWIERHRRLKHKKFSLPILQCSPLSLMIFLSNLKCYRNISFFLQILGFQLGLLVFNRWFDVWRTRERTPWSKWRLKYWHKSEIFNFQVKGMNLNFKFRSVSSKTENYLESPNSFRQFRQVLFPSSCNQWD